MSTTNSTPALQAPTKGLTTYQVAGQEVKLSYDIVRNFLVKGNAAVTEQELVQFISICKFNGLNPFLNEAYLVKFGGQNATAQMIVSKEALLKRAESCPEYDGMKAGIIIRRGDDIVSVEGSFLLTTDVLLGGWAEVWRRDKKYPYVSRVSLSEYDKKQSTWNEKKSTMIRKTAIVQAMREAFPVQIGALYTAEEKGIQDIPYEDITEKVTEEISNNANAGKPISFNDVSAPAAPAAPAASVAKASQPAAQPSSPVAAAPTPTPTPQPSVATQAKAPF
jgi:phage recombination protein Bet